MKFNSDLFILSLNKYLRSSKAISNLKIDIFFAKAIWEEYFYELLQYYHGLPKDIYFDDLWWTIAGI